MRRTDLTGRIFDRIDNDGNYQPGNVRWATWSVQARNQRRRSRTPFPERMMDL